LQIAARGVPSRSKGVPLGPSKEPGGFAVRLCRPRLLGLASPADPQPFIWLGPRRSAPPASPPRPRLLGFRFPCTGVTPRLPRPQLLARRTARSRRKKSRAIDHGRRGRGKSCSRCPWPCWVPEGRLAKKLQTDSMMFSAGDRPLAGICTKHQISTGDQFYVHFVARKSASQTAFKCPGGTSTHAVLRRRARFFRPRH